MARKGSVGFIRAVSKWTRETEERATEVFRESVKAQYDDLYANTPYDTGSLRNSIIVYKAGSPPPQETTGPEGSYSGSAISYMNADSLELGDRAVFAYGRTYWRRLEYGFVGFDSLGRYYNTAGRFFMSSSISRWRSIVRRVARELRGSV